MTKAKYVATVLFIIVALLVIPNIVNADNEITVTREVMGTSGSIKFNFKGLTLDKTHEYEFGLTKTSAEQVNNWFAITDYTETSAVVNVTTGTKELREVVNATDTGYVAIKDKTSDTVILEKYSVDLKIPYLQVTNYTVINNGKEFGNTASECINVGLRNAGNSTAYYQYEKITDQNIINKYKEIKEKNGNVLELQNTLKTTPPNSNWSTWTYWNEHDSSGMNGFGNPENIISAPDYGLYYMWIYFSGENIKDIYGYILIDNLQPEIALEGISLPKTRTVGLNETITLNIEFNPSDATNKIVTWSSSDESVATVDNAGKVTGKKLGSAVITATSQDGNRKATCTVTVTEKSSNNNNNDNNSNNNNASNNGTTNKGSSSTTNGKDNTVAKGKLPQTGINAGIIIAIIAVAGGSILAYIKYNKLKGI